MGTRGIHRCIKRKKIEKQPGENGKSIKIAYDGYHRAWISHTERASSRTHNSLSVARLGCEWGQGTGAGRKGYSITQPFLELRLNGDFSSDYWNRRFCVASQETAAKFGSKNGMLPFLVVLWKGLTGGLPVE